ncbi:MAG: hypothetical protein J7562_12655 [Agrobacterium tumefaciens]|nr:hypothetical protein [Agrobacterium tumefaciens]
MEQRLITPLDKMHSAIQLAAFHYIVCLKAVPTNADHKLVFDKKEYHFENIRTAKNHELHINFQSWAAISVLRDLIENFSIFLMEVYKVALETHPTGSFSCTLTQFERRGIEDQLIVLEKDFAVSPAWIERLTGYNRARNCLAHRAGVVGTNDATDGSNLVVRWLVAEANLQESVSAPVQEVEGPMASLIQTQHIEGRFARVSILDRERRVAVGKTLYFNPNEIFEICQTFQMAAAAFSGLSQEGMIV